MWERDNCVKISAYDRGLGGNVNVQLTAQNVLSLINCQQIQIVK